MTDGSLLVVSCGEGFLIFFSSDVRCMFAYDVLDTNLSQTIRFPEFVSFSILLVF